VLLFQGATISNSYKYELRVTANVRFDGDTPTVNGTDVLELPLKYKCVGNTGATALTAVYQTTDVLP
jgi:hypothetical protein